MQKFMRIINEHQKRCEKRWKLMKKKETECGKSCGLGLRHYIDGYSPNSITIQKDAETASDLDDLHPPAF